MGERVLIILILKGVDRDVTDKLTRREEGK
jgi:hypothetical protein